MIKLLVALLAILPLAGCYRMEAESLRLQMEVGHPMLSGLSGAPRLWAIYRFRPSKINEFKAGDKVAAFLVCDQTGSCSISRIERRSRPVIAEELDCLGGRVIGSSSTGKELVLVLDPFPIQWGAEQERVEMSRNRTKVIEVTYRKSGRGLVFDEVRFVGVIERSPVIWK